MKKGKTIGNKWNSLYNLLEMKRKFLSHLFFTYALSKAFTFLLPNFYDVTMSSKILKKYISCLMFKTQTKSATNLLCQTHYKKNINFKVQKIPLRTRLHTLHGLNSHTQTDTCTISAIVFSSK